MMVPMQNIILVLAFVSLTLTSTNGSSSPSFVFGKCQVGRDTCRDCYISLAESLFQSDDNVFSLSEAFFPPDTNTPEFVVVRYHFKNESMHSVDVWFWAASASYFIYPLATFQFLSLFFGKPEAYWTGEVDVTLNATECFGARKEHLIMLTQRLKIYVGQYDIRPSIDDAYEAEAMNIDAFDDLFNKDSKQLINIVMCIQTLGVLVIFACTVGIIVFVVKCKSRNCDQTLFVKEIKYKSTGSKQAILISLSVSGLLFLLYTVVVDGAAVYYRFCKLSGVYHEGVVYNLPLVALVFDFLALVIHAILLIIAAGVYVKMQCKQKDSNDHQPCHVCSVMLSLLGPLLCIISHSPYVAIAYINDAYYAGSIFIYYMVVFFVCFAAVHVTVRSYINSCVVDESNIWKCFSICTCDMRKGHCYKYECCRQCCHVHACLIIVILLLLFALLSVTVAVISYFVIIPLNGSVSGAPHQLFGFYQTAIIFFGIFITYKTVLHKKVSLKSVVENKDSKDSLSKVKWEDLPDEEKKRKFYGMVIDVVEHKYRKCGDTGNDSRSQKGGSEQEHNIEMKTKIQEKLEQNTSSENTSV